MNETRQSLVSVIMPVFNAGEFLVDAVRSILNQTYKNIELIIVDDASTDGSWQTISSFKKRHPTIIRSIRLKKQMNKGGDACANIGFLKARGTYVARMDADDIAHPDKLEKQVVYMETHPEVLLLGTQARVINREGEVIGEKHVPVTHQSIYESYFVFHPIIHPTVMIRREKLTKRRTLYKIKYSANNDLYTFFELLRIGKFANLPEALLDYRVHGKNDSLTKPKERFFNTLSIRLHALSDGYVPTLKGVLCTVAQTLVIALLPERLIVPLYLYMKGILKLSDQPGRLSFLPVLTRIKTYVYSLV